MHVRIEVIYENGVLRPVGTIPWALHRSEERRVGKECRTKWSWNVSSRRRHTRYIGDWSSDVCSSDLVSGLPALATETPADTRTGNRSTVAHVCASIR